MTRHQQDSDSAESAVIGKSPRAWCKHSCRGEDGGWLCHGAAATTPSLAESAEEGTKVDRLPPPGWMGVPAEKELPPGSDAAEGRAGAASLCRRGTWATSVGSHRALVRKPSKWSPRRPRPKQRVPSPRGRYQTAVGGGRDGTRAAMTRNGLEWPFTRPTFLTGHPRPRTPPGGGTSRPQRRQPRRGTRPGRLPSIEWGRHRSPGTSPKRWRDRRPQPPTPHRRRLRTSERGGSSRALPVSGSNVIHSSPRSFWSRRRALPVLKNFAGDGFRWPRAVALSRWSIRSIWSRHAALL